MYDEPSVSPMRSSEPLNSQPGVPSFAARCRRAWQVWAGKTEEGQYSRLPVLRAWPLVGLAWEGSGMGAPTKSKHGLVHLASLTSAHACTAEGLEPVRDHGSVL